MEQGCNFFYKDLGMDNEQVTYIRQLVEKYMREYPKVRINRLCDYFSWDYEEDFCRYSYTHNREGELYKNRDEIAQYCAEDKTMGFNHIRLHNVPVEDEKAIKKAREYANKIDSIVEKYKKSEKQAHEMGIEMPSINMISNHGYSLEEHEIYINTFDVNYLEVALIRWIEEKMFLKRVVLHEMGHAIADAYGIAEEGEIINLFETYKNGFENIDEFIAECFMASELIENIPLANIVKNILLKRVNN